VVSSSRIAGAAVLGLAGLLFASAAGAQEARQVRVHLTVVHASQTPGPIDPDARRLHQQLQKDFRYQSLRVMQDSRMRMPMREERRVELPTGKALRVRAISIDAHGVLMSLASSSSRSRATTEPLRLARRRIPRFGPPLPDPRAPNRSQRAEMPPSTGITAPVTYAPAREAR
jgi:hypothetical protein